MPEPFDGKKILIVDDDADVLQAIEAALEDSGAELRTARDGNAALQIAESEQPDLILLDLMLPKRSGLLILEKLKAKKPRGSKPYVVMITGNTGTRHRQYAEGLGADGYLTKPFRMDRLMEAATALLSREAR
jgi:two-component system OmpR family response regulator